MDLLHFRQKRSHKQDRPWCGKQNQASCCNLLPPSTKLSLAFTAPRIVLPADFIQINQHLRLEDVSGAEVNPRHCRLLLPKRDRCDPTRADIRLCQGAATRPSFTFKRLPNDTLPRSSACSTTDSNTKTLLPEQLAWTVRVLFRITCRGSRRASPPLSEEKGATSVPILPPFHQPSLPLLSWQQSKVH